MVGRNLTSKFVHRKYTMRECYNQNFSDLSVHFDFFELKNIVQSSCILLPLLFAGKNFKKFAKIRKINFDRRKFWFGAFGYALYNCPNFIKIGIWKVTMRVFSLVWQGYVRAFPEEFGKFNSRIFLLLKRPNGRLGIFFIYFILIQNNI